MKLLDGGTDSGRMNIVALAEGYLESDRKLFEKHAQQLAEQLERESWYRRGLLNVHAEWITSEERAPTAPTGKPNKTYFRSYYGGDRAAHVISGDDEAAKKAVADKTLIAEGAELVLAVHIVVLVNSTLYGGRGGGKGGGLCWSYTDARNPGRWTSCALHELGHSLFGLADEYGGKPALSSPRRTEPTEPNITLDPRGSKWRHLVTGATEGADGYDRGIWRPTRNCRMRSFTEPFCAVCADAARRVLEGYLEEPLGEAKKIKITTAEAEREYPDDSGGCFEAAQFLLRR